MTALRTFSLYITIENRVATLSKEPIAETSYHMKMSSHGSQICSLQLVWREIVRADFVVCRSLNRIQSPSGQVFTMVRTHFRIDASYRFFTKSSTNTTVMDYGYLWATQLAFEAIKYLPRYFAVLGCPECALWQSHLVLSSNDTIPIITIAIQRLE